jgi:tRNA dimethylallyltransferase
LALVGPTASGKTALAIEAARRVGTAVEIVSLDSRQLYRRLDVGTGKPTAAERAAAVHHLVDCIDPDETFDAGRYRRAVEALLPELWARGVAPLLVGGAGFYLKALTEGFHDLPDDPQALADARAEHGALSLEELRARLEAIDPASAERIHENDRYRTERALELHRLTGRTPTELAATFQPRPVHGCQVQVWHLSPPRDVLHRRIAARAARWLKGAWQDEVQGLLDEGLAEDCPGLSILGYREVVGFLRGRLHADALQERVVTATRQYARQQEIWFRKVDAMWRGPLDDRQGLRQLVERLGAAVRGGGPS